MASGPITSWQTEGDKVEAMTDFLFLGSIIMWMVTAAVKSEDDCFLTGKLWQAQTVCWKAETSLCWERSIKSRLWFSQWSCMIVRAEPEEGKVPKNWCLRTVVLEKTLENPLNSKEIKPVNLKANQPWILTGKTNAEVEDPGFWSPEANRWLIGKVLDTGKDQG